VLFVYLLIVNVLFKDTHLSYLCTFVFRHVNVCNLYGKTACGLCILCYMDWNVALQNQLLWTKL